MEFIFVCLTRNPIFSLGSLVRYEVEHEKSYSISAILLNRHTGNDFFDDFRNVSHQSPKVFPNSPKASRTFPNIFRILPEISEDFRGGFEDV